MTARRLATGAVLFVWALATFATRAAEPATAFAAPDLTPEGVRSLAVVKGKLIEMDVDPDEHGRVIERAIGMRFGKGRH